MVYRWLPFVEAILVWILNSSGKKRYIITAGSGINIPVGKKKTPEYKSEPPTLLAACASSSQWLCPSWVPLRAPSPTLGPRQAGPHTHHAREWQRGKRRPAPGREGAPARTPGCARPPGWPRHYRRSPSIGLRRATTGGEAGGRHDHQSMLGMRGSCAQGCRRAPACALRNSPRRPRPPSPDEGLPEGH
jgi:hypothetical protein